MKECGRQESTLKSWKMMYTLALAWKMTKRIYGYEGLTQGPLTLLVKVISKYRKTVTSAKGKLSLSGP